MLVRSCAILVKGQNDHVQIGQICIVATVQSNPQAKSLERSLAVGDFYGTGIEIWAGFGPVRQLLRPFFSCFHEQKINFKNILDGENIFGIE